MPLRPPHRHHTPIAAAMEHLSPAQLTELHRAFSLFARPAAGATEPTLTAPALAAMLAGMGVTGMTEAAAADHIAIADATGRGRLRFADFAALVTQPFGEVADSEYDALFAEMDRDGDGRVGARDLTGFVATVLGGGADSSSASASASAGTAGEAERLRLRHAELAAALTAPDIEELLREGGGAADSGTSGGAAGAAGSGLTRAQLEELLEFQMPPSIVASGDVAAAPAGGADAI